MFEALSRAEYERIMKSKMRSNPLVHKYYAACAHSLISRWANKFTSHQLAILFFVFDRTFYHDKLSETVVFDQFMNGMNSTARDERVFCGLNISLPTLLKQLKELTDLDFLHVRGCLSEDGTSETKARIYAINCKKLFNLDIADEENPMILREPKQKKVAQSADSDEYSCEIRTSAVLKTPRNPRLTPSKNPPKLFEGIYSINTATKVAIVGGTSCAEPSRKINPLEVVEARRVERLNAAAARRPTKPTRTTASNPLSRAAVQDTIDTAMAKYHAALPRVVVSDKPLGVLKKRIAEAKIDIDAFLNWAIQFWQITGSNHERAARRKAGEESKYVHKPIPQAPDFTTLCYRFPYFAACYRSFVLTESVGMSNTKEQQLEKEVAKLKRTVEAAQQDTRGAMARERTLRQRIRPVAEEPPQPALAPRMRRPVRTMTDLELDEEIPAWGEFAPTTRRTK